MHITTAGNVLIPAIKLIKELGYQLKFENNCFTAERNDDIFTAEDPIYLLGLIKLIEIRGENWRVDDDECEKIGKEYEIL
jgi:hypothetical protein